MDTFENDDVSRIDCHSFSGLKLLSDIIVYRVYLCYGLKSASRGIIPTKHSGRAMQINKTHASGNLIVRFQ